MNWVIKEIDSKNDFDKIEKFIKKKFSTTYNIRLSSNYLYWKFKQNKKFNGIIVVALKNNEIIGTASLTFKDIKYNDSKKYIAEIGDTYVDFGAQKFLIEKKSQLFKNSFEERSIFGSMVSFLIEFSKKKKIEFIYGVPNNMSIQAYTKKLNFKSASKLNLYSYVLPNFKISNKKNNFVNMMLKLYRSLLCKVNYINLTYTIEKNLSFKDLKFISKEKKNRYHLDKNKEYFDEKYKYNPQNNFRFCKIYKSLKLIGVFVLKEDFLSQKIHIVDCLCEIEVKCIIKYVLLVVNSHYNMSVNFWEKSENFNFLTRLIYTIFERKMINIIYYDDINLDQYTFFDEFYLGHSDNF